MPGFTSLEFIFLVILTALLLLRTLLSIKIAEIMGTLTLLSSHKISTLYIYNLRFDTDDIEMNSGTTAAGLVQQHLRKFVLV